MTAHPKIAYAGMTHLGLCSAVAAASKGFKTIGYDPDAALVAKLAAGELPVVEPELDFLLRDHTTNMLFSADITTLGQCDLIYVAPDVPTDDNGRSDLSGLDALLEGVLAATRPDAVIVVLSQVPPGFTAARQRLGRQIYYQVETLVFGRAVERATKPERFIVGCPDSSNPLPTALEAFLKTFGCPILPMRFESAELAKISINMCLIASVGAANMMAELCERVGADWGEIVPSLRLDRRIGQYSYIVPGLGIAGGNLERDVATVCRLSAETGTDSGIARAWMANSIHRKLWPFRMLHTKVLSKQTDPIIAVLGLAYKENTASIKNSASIELIRRLIPFRIRAYDPVVRCDPEWHPRLTQVSSALETCKGADAVCLMTPWPEFTKLVPVEVAQQLTGKILIDPFALLDRKSTAKAGLDHSILGTQQC